ncbi:MAG: hypothetical protein GEU83_08815 [Pseudonocardiaceae bacterium]|nr:hypothetical protein [Pseudonocardiaceae bacterium]
MRPDAGARGRTATTLAVVTSVTALTPRMLRVRLGGGGLADLRAFPGQTVQFLVPDDGGAARRDYTVRHYDPESAMMDVDFALHADGPATRRARQAEAGQSVEFVGPAGRHWPDPTADWHLFAGDETALPAVAAMAESLSADSPVRIYLEVTDAAEEQRLAATVRRGPARGTGQDLGSRTHSHRAQHSRPAARAPCHRSARPLRPRVLGPGTSGTAATACQ